MVVTVTSTKCHPSNLQVIGKTVVFVAHCANISCKKYMLSNSECKNSVGYPVVEKLSSFVCTYFANSWKHLPYYHQVSNYTVHLDMPLHMSTQTKYTNCFKKIILNTISYMPYFSLATLVIWLPMNQKCLIFSVQPVYYSDQIAGWCFTTKLLCKMAGLYEVQFMRR